MSYTPTTWVTGDTITATKLNKMEQGIAGASPWDAVIRLTHSNNSGRDLDMNLTPSIVSGSFAELTSIISNFGYPHVLVEYYHPWGYYGWLEGVISYISPYYIHFKVAGFFPFGNDDGEHFYYLWPLVWTSSDTIVWDT